MQSLTTIFFSLTSCLFFFLFFFFHDPPPTGLYTLSLHDALPISGGYPPLRQYLSTYLLRFGLEARPDDILIVNGSQQGFDLIARTLLDPGDAVAIEEPTYPRALQVFRSFGAQPLAVPWDAAGPRVDVFERLLDRHAPKLFYCQPSAHNPTGLSLAPETARARAQIGRAHV